MSLDLPFRRFSSERPWMAATYCSKDVNTDHGNTLWQVRLIRNQEDNPEAKCTFPNTYSTSFILVRVWEREQQYDVTAQGYIRHLQKKIQPFITFR